MTHPDHQQTFRQSLDRCRGQDDFLERFYRSFMDSSEEVRNMFSHTDFDAQKQRLLESLLLAADVANGDAVAMRHLHERAESHDRRHLNIKPALYDKWLDSLIVTAKACDPEFDSDVEAAWRGILGHIIGYMRAHY